MATDEGNNWNETWHWPNNKIRVALLSWLQVRVEPIEWVQILLKLAFYSYFKQSFIDEYHVYQFIPLHSLITSRIFWLNKRGDRGRQQRKWKLRLNKRWNWSSCKKLALTASWTHGVIAQSVRASEQNSVVVGSNPTLAVFL